jgi:hypothetical protein
MDKIKLYSPNQVGCAAFIGGPFAAVFVLWTNFRALGKGAAAEQTLIGCGFLILALLLVLSFLPDSFPNHVIPVAYTLAAWLFADKYQLSKPAIRESEQFEFQSNWIVFGISITMLVASGILIFAWAFALGSFDVSH